MIPILILSVAMAARGQNAPTEPAWAKQVLSSGRAIAESRHSKPRQVIGSRARSAPTGGAKDLITYDPLIDPIYDREHKLLYHEFMTVRYLENLGELKRAMRRYNRLEARFPQQIVAYACDKISLEYLLGEKNLAFGDTVAEFSRTMSAQPWLLLAAVSAANGQVFPGQLEYCERTISKNFDYLSLPLSMLPRWRPTSAKDVEMAACMAIGVQLTSFTPVVESPTALGLRIPFLERAFAAYPSNSAIARNLAMLYDDSRQFSKARELDNQMLSVLSNLQERKWFSDDLRYSEGKADVPPTKPVFDDGGA